MKKSYFKNTEWSILICALLLLSIGLVALYSCTQNTELDEFKKQIMWFLVSTVILIIIMCVDYHFIEKVSPFFYGIFILLLIAVLFTPSINGARSWFDLGFFLFQPGEFAKVFVIIFLSYVITKIQKKGRDELNRPLKLLLALSVVALPIILIVMQPDYGTAAAFLIATAFMLFVSGIDKKYIIVTFLLIIILLPIMYFFILPQHARTRIDVFLNPELDARGARIQYYTI